MFFSQKTENVAKKVAPDHTTFSDQTHRHRRNLLIITTLILACAFSGATATRLPFGIIFKESIISPNILCMLGVAYFLLAFWTSASSEFKSRADEEEDTSTTIYLATAPTTISGKAASALSTIRQLEDSMKDNKTPTSDNVKQVIDHLQAYAQYQSSIWRYWQLRFVIDFWLPLLLGFLAIISLAYLQSTGGSILPTNCETPLQLSQLYIFTSN